MSRNSSARAPCQNRKNSSPRLPQREDGLAGRCSIPAAQGSCVQEADRACAQGTLTLYDSIRCWVITVTFSSTALNLFCVAWEIKVTTSAGTSVIPSFLAKAKKTKHNRISLPPIGKKTPKHKQCSKGLYITISFSWIEKSMTVYLCGFGDTLDTLKRVWLYKFKREMKEFL